MLENCQNCLSVLLCIIFADSTYWFIGIALREQKRIGKTNTHTHISVSLKSIYKSKRLIKAHIFWLHFLLAFVSFFLFCYSSMLCVVLCMVTGAIINIRSRLHTANCNKKWLPGLAVVPVCFSFFPLVSLKSIHWEEVVVAIAGCNCKLQPAELAIFRGD